MGGRSSVLKLLNFPKNPRVVLKVDTVADGDMDYRDRAIIIILRFSTFTVDLSIRISFS